MKFQILGLLQFGNSEFTCFPNFEILFFRWNSVRHKRFSSFFRDNIWQRGRKLNFAGPMVPIGPHVAPWSGVGKREGAGRGVPKYKICFFTRFAARLPARACRKNGEENFETHCQFGAPWAIYFSLPPGGAIVPHGAHGPPILIFLPRCPT